MMEDKTLLALVAIVCLAALEAVCIFTGTDGQFFLPIVAAIAGLGGFAGGQFYERQKPCPDEEL